MPNLQYYVLSDDNIDTLVDITGRTKEALRNLLTDAKAYGHYVVLWKEFGTWFAIRIDALFIKDGELDVVMQEILRRPH